MSGTGFCLRRELGAPALPSLLPPGTLPAPFLASFLLHLVGGPSSVVSNLGQMWAVVGGPGELRVHLVASSQMGSLLPVLPSLHPARAVSRLSLPFLPGGAGKLPASAGPAGPAEAHAFSQWPAWLRMADLEPEAEWAPPPPICLGIWGQLAKEGHLWAGVAG